MNALLTKLAPLSLVLITFAGCHLEGDDLETGPPHDRSPGSGSCLLDTECRDGDYCSEDGFCYPSTGCAG